MGPMRLRWAGLWLVLLAGPVLGQDVTLEPSAAQRCLTPVAERRGTPEYPPQMFQRGQAGRVEVELVFGSADRGPDMKVLVQEGDDSFVAAVKNHVRDYRVPCLGSGEASARLQINFVFAPDKRQAHWSTPIDAGSVLRMAQLDCVRHESGDQAPDYPASALRGNVQGRVLAKLRFTSPDQAPQAEVLARPRAKMLAREVTHWVQGYRMPCFSGEPVEAVWTFQFTFEGESYGFNRAMTLQEVLPAVRGIRAQTLNFDTTEMACPFEVKLQYRRPGLPNAVGEVAPEGTQAATPFSPNPARRPLLDWLASMELDIPPTGLDTVYGDTVTLAIPCIKINLTPKE